VNSKASNHFTQSPTTNNEFDRVKEERKTVGKKKKETEQQSNLLEPPSIVAKNLRTSGSHADHRKPLSRLVSLSLTGAGGHSFSLARKGEEHQFCFVPFFFIDLSLDVFEKKKSFFMVICGYNKLIMEDKLQIIRYDFRDEQTAEGRNTKRLVQS
jgi:hypothetical protein